MILLTGGTGFLGGFLVKSLLEGGHKVRILARNPAKVDFSKYPEIEVVEGDVLDVLSISRAMEGVDSVVHAAAMVSFWKKRHPIMLQSNIEGAANMVNMALEHGVSRLVHVSSISALGRSAQGGVINEKNPWKTSPYNTVYAKSKYAAELEVLRGMEEGLNVTILSPAFIIGPGDWTSGTPHLFQMIYDGFRFYNRGRTGVVAATDVAKVVNQILPRTDLNGEKFILSAENLYFKDMFGQMAKAMGKKPPFIVAPQSLMRIMGKIYEMVADITEKEPLITPETALISGIDFQYDGRKITKSIDFEYREVTQLLEETAKTFLAELKT